MGIPPSDDSLMCFLPSFSVCAALAAFLRGASPPDTDESAGAEVCRKLIAGILGELSSRRLAI